MSTVRRGRMAADDFAHVSNQFARDARLSLKDRGLGLWLFSHRDGWNLSIRSIAKQVGAGVESVQTSLKALEKYGYLTREQKPGENGRFGEMDYVITDIPAGDDAYGKPVRGDETGTEQPAEDPTADREPDTHKKTTPKETNPQGDQSQGEISRNGSAVMDGGLFAVDAPEASNGDAPTSEVDGQMYPTFLEFWATYPIHKGKAAAMRAWDKAMYRVRLADRPDRARAIVAGAQRYRDEPGREDKYTKHPATWLNGGCWEDEPIPVGSGRNPRGGGSRYRDSESYPGEAPWFDPAALEDDT